MSDYIFRDPALISAEPRCGYEVKTDHMTIRNHTMVQAVRNQRGARALPLISNQYLI